MERRVIHVFTHSLYNIHHASKKPSLSDFSRFWHVRLAKHLKAASDEYAHECWSLDPTLDKQIKLEVDGIPIRLFPCKRLRYTGEYSRDVLHELKKEVRKQDAILHFHELFTYATLLAPLVIKHAPMIVQHHGNPSLLQQSRRSSLRFNKLAALTLYSLTGNWFFERVSIPRFDRIFVCNREDEAYVARFAGAEHVERLTMGIDFDAFVPMNKDKVREMLEFGPETLYIIHVGALVARKGVEDLMKAFPPILKEFPNTILLFIGTGYMKQRLLDLAQKLEVRTNVKFLPSSRDSLEVSDDLIPLYYNAADVVVVPSWTEGLAIVAVEALACGVPFIGTTVPGLLDVTRQFRGGVLVPPRSPGALASAVIDVLSGRQSFSYDRENAKRVYDWSFIVKRNLEVYAEVYQSYYA